MGGARLGGGSSNTRGDTWLWASRYSRGIMVIRDATWQACLSKRFFPLLSPRPGHGLQLPRDSNTSIHSATSYSSSAPALSCIVLLVFSIISAGGKVSYRKSQPSLYFRTQKLRLYETSFIFRAYSERISIINLT